MQARNFGRGWIVWGLVWLLPGVVQAQPEPAPIGRPDSASLSGTGSETLRRPPARLRVIVELLGKGKSLEEALGKLKDRREAALLTLESLQAAKDSISVSDPGESVAQASQRRQMEQMIRQRMVMSRGRKPSKPQLPVSVSASVILIADWPLTGDTPEKRLLAAHAIQEKVKAADLAGTKEAEKLSPEEEELREEGAEMMQNSGQETVAPGTPQFLYVAQISAEDRDQAMAKAVAKAKAHAARLAHAAGVHLGPLITLNDMMDNVTINGEEGQIFAARNYGPYGMDPSAMYLQQLLGSKLPPALRDKENEVMGIEPESLQFTFRVSATFTMQP